MYRDIGTAEELYSEATGQNPADATTGNPFRYTGRRDVPQDTGTEICEQLQNLFGRW